MAHVHFVQADGLPRQAPMELALKGRRRLSAIMRQYDLDTGRSEPIVVSVTRANRLQKFKLNQFVDAISKPGADCEVLRDDWRRTLVGPRDVITIMVLPLGGGGGSGGSRGAKSGVAIGATIAALALAVIAPFAVPALSGLIAGGTATLASNIAASVIYGGLIIGLNYVASRAAQAKANKESDNRPLYGVSGGGNLPKPGDRVPVIYGETWTVPPLSQPDYSIYEGDEQILYKRMTIGCGEYTPLAVRIGTQEVWRAGSYLNGLGSSVQVEFIAPGGTSALVPGTITASPDVVGIDLPRPGLSPEWAGPFRVAPAGVEVTKIQFNVTCPGGVFVMGPTGSKFAGTSFSTAAHPVLQYALADGNGNPVGAWNEVPSTLIEGNQQKPIRRTFTVNVAAGQYVVRAKNLAAEIPSTNQGANGVTWDFAGGYIEGQILRPGISEMGMKIKAGPGLSITQFSQIEVLVRRKMPVWRAGNFITQETRKALDACVDIAVDPNYGLGLLPEEIDLAKVSAYLGSLTQFNTFDGQINGPISGWEALALVLGPMRAEPVQRGSILSFQRDEPQIVRKHHFTRRQIVSGTSAVEISLDRGQGAASIRSEFSVGGDPRRRGEASAQYGPVPLASTLVAFEGVTDFNHAEHLARWTAASNFYRCETRTFRVELQHRSIAPGDRVGVDTWWLENGIAIGLVAQIPGNTYRFSIDCDVVWPDARPSPLYAYIIDRQGREFGPLFCNVNEAERWIDFSPTDVALAQTQSGMTLAQAMQPDDGGLPTHCRLGSLTGITEDWIVRAVRPTDAFRADITVVNDANEVWTALGEEPGEPPPLTDVPDANPPIPRVTWVRATVSQVAQGLVCNWSVSPTRGAIGYEVQISRDGGATWGEISNGSSTTGAFAIEHIETAENRIRARAWGRFGVPGPWALNIFSTVPESITGPIADELDLLAADLLNLNNVVLPALQNELNELNNVVLPALQNDLSQLQDDLGDAETAITTLTGETLPALTADLDQLGEDLTANTAALAQVSESFLQSGLGDDFLDRLAEQAATHAGTALEQITLAKIEQGNNYAAILEERRLRIEEGEVSATRIDALVANVDGVGTVSLEELRTAFSKTNGTLGASYTIAVAANGSALGGIEILGLRRPGYPDLFQVGINGDLVVTGTFNGNRIIANTVQGDRIIANTLQGDRLVANTVNGNVVIANTLQGDRVIANTLSGDRVVANTMLGDRIVANSLSGDRVIANTLSGDRVIANTMLGDRIIANTLSGDRVITNSLTADQISFNTIRRGNVVVDEITRFRQGTQITNTNLTTSWQVFYNYVVFIPDIARIDIDYAAVVPWQGSPNNIVYGELYINGSLVDSASVLAANAFWRLTANVYVAAGTYTIAVRWYCNVNGGATVFKETFMLRESYR